MTRAFALAWMCWVISGCATTKPAAYAPLFGAAKRVEEKPLPPDPAEEALPKLPDGSALTEWVEPLEKGSCIDATGKAVGSKPCPAVEGLAVSEGQATRDLLFRTRYRELRRLYDADRGIWSAHRELYEERLRTADEALKKAEPDWWQRNKGEVGTITGFVLGVAVTIGVVYALTPATK